MQEYICKDVADRLAGQAKINGRVTMDKGDIAQAVLDRMQENEERD